MDKKMLFNAVKATNYKYRAVIAMFYLNDNQQQTITAALLCCIDILPVHHVIIKDLVKIYCKH